MKVRFLLPARDELRVAMEYYERQRAGLGSEFRDEARATVLRIQQFPRAWHPMGDAIRRCQMQRFPYCVIYAPLEQEIVVIAIAHLHQEPTYWRHRVMRPGR